MERRTSICWADAAAVGPEASGAKRLRRGLRVRRGRRRRRWLQGVRHRVARRRLSASPGPARWRRPGSRGGQLRRPLRVDRRQVRGRSGRRASSGPAGGSSANRAHRSHLATAHRQRPRPVVGARGPDPARAARQSRPGEARLPADARFWGPPGLTRAGVRRLWPPAGDFRAAGFGQDDPGAAPDAPPPRGRPPGRRRSHPRALPAGIVGQGPQAVARVAGRAVPAPARVPAQHRALTRVPPPGDAGAGRAGRGRCRAPGGMRGGDQRVLVEPSRWAPGAVLPPGGIPGARGSAHGRRGGDRRAPRGGRDRRLSGCCGTPLGRGASQAAGGRAEAHRAADDPADGQRRRPRLQRRRSE